MKHTELSESSGHEVENLINLMAKLPGFGKRSARRAVLKMINKRVNLLEPLAKAISDVNQKACLCVECGNIGTSSVCLICSDPKRDSAKLCIVSEVSDLWAIERAGIFKGKFFVLGGVLSALDGVGPDELRIPDLLEKIKCSSVSEVILALSATIDGQTTAHYIADKLVPFKLSVTSLAHGVPVGGELEYLDEGTLDVAFRLRKDF